MILVHLLAMNAAAISNCRRMLLQIKLKHQIFLHLTISKMTINYLRLEPDTASTAATAVIAETQTTVLIETLPFDEWARGAVYSNLKETIGPPQQRAIPSFNDWAGGVVFNGIDLTMKALFETNIKISSSDDKSVQQDEEEEAPHPENKLEHDITSSPTITKVPMPQHNQQEPIMKTTKMLPDEILLCTDH